MTLQDKIVNFLTSLPNIHDTESQRAFIYHAGFDPQLQDQITFGKPPAQFVPLLVSILIKYGKLNDGQYALEAVLETAKNYVGQDRKAYCETLLQELRDIVKGQVFPKQIEEGLRLTSRDADNPNINFFDPANEYETQLVYRSQYVSPYKPEPTERPDQSTTTRFIGWMANIFREIRNQRNPCSFLEEIRVEPDTISRIAADTIQSNVNVISYASSTINPITDLMMTELEVLFGHTLRFVYEEDLRSNKLKSSFEYSADEKQAKPCGLLYGNTILYRDLLQGVDHGFIVRAQYKLKVFQPKIWWIIAGCGRPASVAAQELLFNPIGNVRFAEELNSRMPAWLNQRLLALIFTCRYDTSVKFNIPSVSSTNLPINWNLKPGRMEIDIVDLLAIS